MQKVVTAKSDTTPPDFEQGVVNVLRKSGVSLGEIAFLAHGTTLIHQRARRAQGREDRAHHDGGSRLDRDRARQPAGLLQPPLRQAAAVRAALPAARGAGTTRADRRRAPAARSPACPQSSATSAPTGSRRSRSACSTPTRTRRTRRPCSRVREPGRRSRPSLAPDQSRVARVRADEHRRPVGVRSSSVERYLGRLAEEPARGGFGGQLYVMQSNCGVDSVEKTKEIPITMVESDRPAASGARLSSALIGDSNVLALDIGGRRRSAR